MITEQGIEDKDFSFGLSSIIARLEIVGDTIDDDTSGDKILALMDIIGDAVRDLKIIARGLYGPEALSEPATAPISDEEG